MSVRLTVTTNAGALAVRYADASKVYARSLLTAMRQVERETVRGLRTTIGIVLSRRSGLMARKVRGTMRLTDDVMGQGGTFDLRVRSTVWYAGVQERGAVQTPKTAAHLAIPLFDRATSRRFGEGANASGRMRARDLIASPGRFGFSGTFTRDGILFGRLLDHDQIVPMFALRRSVTIPGRHAHELTRTFMQPRALEILGAAVSDATAAVAAGHEAA